MQRSCAETWAAPLLPEIGVLALVPDSWDAYWQPRHHVLSRLARYYQVLWLDPAHYWQESLDRMMRPVATNGDIPPGFGVYRPEPWLPHLFRPQWMARLTFAQRIQRGIRRLRRQGCKKIVLYLWRPEFVEALDLARGVDLTCYHIDDEYTFSSEDQPIPEEERAILTRVEQVFIHSPGLFAKKGKFNPNTLFVPNGVDYHRFRAASSEPEDLRGIPYPRIGYNGFLKQQLDWDLLLHLAEDRPEWTFVFVGPRSNHPQIADVIARMNAMPNVRFLGPKPWHELGAYAQHFDVSIMPYDRTSDYVQYIFPLKLHEYLATGCPVVGSRIRSLEDFQDVVELAETKEEWERAIVRSLAPVARSRDKLAARQAIARGNDWGVLVRRIAATMGARLGLESHDVFLAEEAEAAGAITG